MSWSTFRGERELPLNNALISRISSLVEAACKDKENAYGFGIWDHHVVPMLSVAHDLAVRVGADREIVAISVLLHDYAGIVDQKQRDSHHIHGAVEAERILRAEGYPEKKIEVVKACIRSHRGSVPSAKDTKEQECVADADAIVHMRTLPALFFVAYRKLDLDIDAGKEWVTKKIERDWQKLSDVGKRAARGLYESFRVLLK